MRVTVKGQVTLPKRVRERYGIKPGMEVEIVEDAGRIVVRRPSERHGWESLIGIAASSEWKHTDDFINAIRGKP